MTFEKNEKRKKHAADMSFPMVLIGAVLVGYIFTIPHERKLEMEPMTYEGPERHAGLMKDKCIEGVTYASSLGLPHAAVVGADGKANRCSGGHQSLRELENRYRLICRDGVEYVRMNAGRAHTLFIRYDTDTRLPKRCG